jgi:hypothetical protein
MRDDRYPSQMRFADSARLHELKAVAALFKTATGGEPTKVARQLSGSDRLSNIL